MNVRDKHFEEGVVPPGWKIQKFMDTMILQRGFDLPSKSRTAGPFPLIASNGNIDSHIDFKVKAPAIVTGRSGTIGKVYYEIKDCWPLNTTLYVKEMHGNDPRFLYYFLLNFDLNRFATGTGVPTLNRNVVHDQFVSIPTSIGEQRKIAEILSTVDEKIEVIESQITQTQELKRGLMQRLLTKGIGHTQFKHSPLGEIPDSWNVEKLGDHIVKVGSGITPRGGHESYVKNGVLFLRSQNVLRGKLNLTDVAYIPIEQHNKMSGSKVQIGDVLLNITGASIGRSCVVPSSVQEANVNQHVCIIRPTEDINSTFLSQWLNSEFGVKQIDKFQAGGNREGLNYQQIRSFMIPLPSYGEQNKIATLLISVDEKIEVLREKRDGYKVLKRGLMQQLLTGKLRVNQSNKANEPTKPLRLHPVIEGE